ncbi:MAG: hypothetical protein ACK5MX_00675, partial [Pseudanabaena sp.]
SSLISSTILPTGQPFLLLAMVYSCRRLSKENGGDSRRHSLLGFYVLIRLETDVVSHNHIQIFYSQQILQDAHRHKLCCNKAYHLP